MNIRKVLVALVLTMGVAFANDLELLTDRVALAKALKQRVSMVRMSVYEDYYLARRAVYAVSDANGVIVDEIGLTVFGLNFVMDDTSRWLYLEVDLLDSNGRILFGAEKSFHAVKAGNIWQVPERAMSANAYLWYKVPVNLTGVSASIFDRSGKEEILYQSIGSFMFPAWRIGTASSLHCQYPEGELVIDLCSPQEPVVSEEDWFWMIDPSYRPPPSEFNKRVVVPSLTIIIAELNSRPPN
jgi:hypothetical protein